MDKASLQCLFEQIRNRHDEGADKAALIDFVVDVWDCPDPNFAETVVQKALEDRYVELLDPPYELSENQTQFVRDALKADLDIDFTYSGRGMFGKECPSVVVDNADEFSTNADCSTDQMGLRVVVYASY